MNWLHATVLIQGLSIIGLVVWVKLLIRQQDWRIEMLDQSSRIRCMEREQQQRDVKLEERLTHLELFVKAFPQKFDPFPR